LPDTLKGIRDTEIRRLEDYSFPRIMSAIKSKEKAKPSRPTGFKRIYMGRETQAEPEPKPAEKTPEEIEAEREAQRQREQKIRHEAYTQGMADAKEQAEKDAAMRVEATFSALGQAAERFIAELDRCRWEMEHEVVGLSLAIAKKIIGKRVAADRDIVVDIARKALMVAPSLKAATVRVHPQDYENVMESLSSTAAYASLLFEADPRVARGGCVVETLSGEVDAVIASQIQVVEEAFSALTMTSEEEKESASDASHA
jgi:flagellar assembly protein FliH